MILNNTKAFDQDKNEINLLIKDASITIPKEDIPENTDHIIFDIPFFNKQKGDSGYYAVADIRSKETGVSGGYLCFFGDKQDFDCLCPPKLMPIFGIKTEEDTVLGVVTGMRLSFFVNVGVSDNKYYLKPYFQLDGDRPYEDIRIEFYSLGKDAEYSDMAIKYRQLQLENGCVPIAERSKDNPYIKYAAESVEIRVRMGWKPVPSKILEQTVGNEPEMKVACTFDRVKDLIDELKLQGVEKAQICLVGWNKSGHDGRYPDLFPVEEKLGGEEKLRELIAYAQNNGYQITCHTNSTDCYSISKDFSNDIVLKNKDNTLSIDNAVWAGGRMYHLCPKVALDFAKRDLPKVADLGFRGTHYIDVMTTVWPRTCYDENHPSSAKQTVEYYKEIMKLCHEKIGGFASEGAFDFAAEYLDYALYVTVGKYKGEFFDRRVPLWEITYHGIILSNPSTSTMNYTIKDNETKNYVYECGGRPVFYIYSKFIDSTDNNSNWLGAEDLILDTDEQLKYTVSKIKEGYDEMIKNNNHQTEFIVKHEYLSDSKIKTTYSSGAETVVDYD